MVVSLGLEDWLRECMILTPVNFQNSGVPWTSILAKRSGFQVGDPPEKLHYEKKIANPLIERICVALRSRFVKKEENKNREPGDLLNRPW